MIVIYILIIIGKQLLICATDTIIVYIESDSNDCDILPRKETTILFIHLEYWECEDHHNQIEFGWGIVIHTKCIGIVGIKTIFWVRE